MQDLNPPVATQPIASNDNPNTSKPPVFQEEKLPRIAVITKYTLILYLLVFVGGIINGIRIISSLKGPHNVYQPSPIDFFFVLTEPLLIILPMALLFLGLKTYSSSKITGNKKERRIGLLALLSIIPAALVVVGIILIVLSGSGNQSW